jgi:hypothetical protein
MTRKTAVIEVTEVSVEAPLVDGARAWVHEHGFFSAYEKAISFVHRTIAEKAKDADDDAGIRYFVLDEKVLDAPRLEDTGDTMFLGADGGVRGLIHGAYETPWGGRDPETCKYKVGQLVGFVDDGRYRVGVVNGLPVSPDEASRWSDVTLGDDLYLIGVFDKDGSPETNDHEHIPEPLLFEVEHEVAPELRKALKKRQEGYGLVPVGGSGQAEDGEELP